jgi:hypothetical protein
MQPQADLSRHQPAQRSGHEPIEVGVRAAFYFGLGLVALAIVILIIQRGFMRQFELEEKRLATLRPARFAKGEAQEFPPPRLQGNPARDTAEFVASEREALRNYSSDSQKKIATIPIERAMDLVLERGLPVHREGGK